MGDHLVVEQRMEFLFITIEHREEMSLKNPEKTLVNWRELIWDSVKLCQYKTWRNDISSKTISLQFTATKNHNKRTAESEEGTQAIKSKAENFPVFKEEIYCSKGQKDRPAFQIFSGSTPSFSLQHILSKLLVPLPPHYPNQFQH